MILAQARTHHRVKSASRYAAYFSRPARMYTDCAPGGVCCRDLSHRANDRLGLPHAARCKGFHLMTN